jgi:hypothetical protein
MNNSDITDAIHGRKKVWMDRYVLQVYSWHAVERSLGAGRTGLGASGGSRSTGLHGPGQPTKSAAAAMDVSTVMEQFRVV